MARLRVRALITVAVTLSIILTFRLIFPAEQYAEALAYTECPFRGKPRVTVTSLVAPDDTFPVRLHEEVHATQCRQLGPLRYRLRNLTSRGKLALEAPAYCAGARARISRGMNAAAVRERVVDDATAAFKGAMNPLLV